MLNCLHIWGFIYYSNLNSSKKNVFVSQRLAMLSFHLCGFFSPSSEQIIIGFQNLSLVSYPCNGFPSPLHSMPVCGESLGAFSLPFCLSSSPYLCPTSPPFSLDLQNPCSYHWILSYLPWLIGLHCLLYEGLGGL